MSVQPSPTRPGLGGPGVYVVHRVQQESTPIESWLGAPSQAEMRTVFADEFDADEAMAWLATVPLWGTGRLLLVRHAQEIPEAGLAALARMLQRHPLASGWLVLWDGSPEGRLVRAAGALGAAWHLIPQEGTGAEQRIRARIESLALSEPAARLVLAVLRRFPERAEVELGKLEAWGTPTLSESDARAILAADLLEEVMASPGSDEEGKAGERRRFRMGEAALEGRGGEALQLAGALIREGMSPSSVCREIARQAMDLWELLELTETSRASGDDVATLPALPPAYARRPPFALRASLRRARRLGRQGLLRVLRWAVDADYDAKAGNQQPMAAVQRLLARMAAPDAVSPDGQEPVD